MTSFYCTLADVKDEQDVNAAANTTQDARIFQLIRQVSQRVDRLFQSNRPQFWPYLEDRKFRVTPDRVNSLDNTFWFRDNLLALNTVTLGTTALVVATDVEAWPTIPTPYQYLRLLAYTDSWYDNCWNSSYTPLFLQINGTWGFHTEYANAWLATTTVAVATATNTTITLTDVDGTDGYGRSPWISPGALLRIENEYLLVTAANTTTNVLTVKRGMNGTTGVNHGIGTGVDVWQVEDVLRRCVARQSAFLYARRGAYESAQVTDIGIANYPSDLLAELRGVVHELVYI